MFTVQHLVSPLHCDTGNFVIEYSILRINVTILYLGKFGSLSKHIDDQRDQNMKHHITYGISHDIGGHLFPFLHKNLDLKYKTWLGGHTFFYVDMLHGNTNSRVKINSINVIFFKLFTTFHWKYNFFDG